MNARYFLAKYLVLPFTLIAAACVFASTGVREPWKGLLVNVGAAFIGSIVTVLYVDKVLGRHQEAIWSRVRSKVLFRLERVANATISSVRTAFGLAPPNVQHDPMNLRLIREEILQLAERRLVPSQPFVEAMDQQEWRTLALSLQGSVQEIDRLLALFWRNLDSAQTLLLLQIQEDALLIITNFSILPDILGVPEHLLPKKRDGSSSVPLQRALNTRSAQDIEKLLRTCARLLHSLPPQQEFPWD